MNRCHFLMLLLTFSAMLLAQNALSQYPQGEASRSPYEPAVPAPRILSPYGNPYSGYWGGGGGGTAAGSAMNGMASMISAAGQRNLSNSAAAINWTEAQKNEIENQQQWAATYFAMREANQKARAAKRGPNLTVEEIARIAKQGAPRPLGPSQLNPFNGELYWPIYLQQPIFAAQRSQVDQLFTVRANYGALSYPDQTKVHELLEVMFQHLKAQIQQIRPQDYAICRSFLLSVNYAATGTFL